MKVLQTIQVKKNDITLPFTQRDMRIEQLKEILLTWKKYSFQYQQKLAKEFFIKKALEFIYKHSLYPQLTFNG